MLSRYDVGLKEESCELPSGDNLRDGDVVHLRATFRRPASWSPTTHGVFRFGGIGGLEVFAPFAEIVDVELPPLKVGDRVVTPDGHWATVAGIRNNDVWIVIDKFNCNMIIDGRVLTRAD